MKREAGGAWKESMQLISQTIDDLKTVSLNEAAKTEEGRKYLESIADRLLFIQLKFVGEASELLDEIDAVLEKSIRNESISEEELTAYKENVRIFAGIVERFDMNFETDLDWYEGFTEEKSPNKATQIIEQILKN